MSNRRLGEPLDVFERLCIVGNALVVLRNEQEPCSDLWTHLTCLILQLDTAIDALVRGEGLPGDSDDA